MIGDLILWIKKIYKRQTCIHDYKFKPDKFFGGRHDHYECLKCGKITFNLNK